MPEKLSRFCRRLELRKRVQFFNAEVKAFDRLRIVRGRNSSPFGSKCCTLRAGAPVCPPRKAPAIRVQRIWRFISASDERFSELAVFNLRFYVRVRRLDEPS